MNYMGYKTDGYRNTNSNQQFSTLYNSTHSLLKKQSIKSRPTYYHENSNEFSDYIRQRGKTYDGRQTYDRTTSYGLARPKLQPYSRNNWQSTYKNGLNPIKTVLDKQPFLKLKHYPHSCYCSEDTPKAIQKQHHKCQSQNSKVEHIHHHHYYTTPQVKVQQPVQTPQVVINQTPSQPIVVEKIHNIIREPIKNHSEPKIVRFQYMSPTSSYCNKQTPIKVMTKPMTVSTQYYQVPYIPQENIINQPVRQLDIKSSRIMHNNPTIINQSSHITYNDTAKIKQSRPSIFKTDKLESKIPNVVISPPHY